MMKKRFNIFGGLLLCSILLLFACSKRETSDINPESADKPRLVLEVNASDITEGDEVEFIVKVDKTIVPADIYVDGKK